MIGKIAAAGAAATAALVAIAVGGLLASTTDTEQTGGGNLAFPGADYGAPGIVCVQSAELKTRTLPGWNAQQLANAATIVAVGQSLGIPAAGQVVAVATAMQESSLENLDHGDTDTAGNPTSSLGLFQQIAAWGPAAGRTDPAKAAAMFYTGGAAGQKGLTGIDDWQSMPVTVAAQAVQHSAFPDAYAKWAAPARAMVGLASGMACPVAAAPGAGATAAGQAVIARAMTQLGVPYAWGGGNADGPTRGIHDGGVADAHGDYLKVGFDCSGLAQYAYAAIGAQVPHQTQAIWAAFPHITDRAQLLPGDLLLYSSNGTATGIHHVAIYLGGDSVIEAPDSGSVVSIRSGIWSGSYGREFIGAVRPQAAVGV